MTAWTQDTARDDQPPREDDDLAELLAPPGRRASRLTWVLAALILAVGSFTAGALAHTGSSTAQAASGTTTQRRASGGEGFGAGGFPGAGAGGAPGAAAGSGGAGPGAAQGGAASGAATPAVVGTVVKVAGSTLTVKNLGGKTVTVTVPDGVEVAATTKQQLSSLKRGASVVVAGSTGADGSVTASGITQNQ